ncbi:MAG: ATPase V [Myxococcota bacterium]|nr:ATPase V [Myxococcota bacterium]
MSIVPLSKVTFLGHRDDKTEILLDLQSLGCLHVIPLTANQWAKNKGGPTSNAREALKYLLSCARKRHQVSDPSRFDAAYVERRALEIRDEVHSLEHEQDFLEARIKGLRPWGDFKLPPREALGGYRLWFYQVPLHDVKHLQKTELMFEVVTRDNRFAYVVVVSMEEPQGMPVVRTRTGKVSLHDLVQRLEEVALALEDLQAERAGLTRWCRLYASLLFRLEDGEQRLRVSEDTLDVDPLFALQAWAPTEKADTLKDYADKKGLVFEMMAPAPEDAPPTLLHNKPLVASGQDLVSFYMMPNYRLWDPSSMVFFSFSIFFAMILSDAGYALVMLAGLLLLWRKLGRSDVGRRMRILFALLTVTSAVWGMLVGSYFGYGPKEGSLLTDLHVLSVNNFDVMMKLSIFIGVGHLILANLADAKRRGLSKDTLVPVGWITIFLGAVSLWLSQDRAVGELIVRSLGGDTFSVHEKMSNTGSGMMIAGALAVLCFTPASGPVHKQIFAGVISLTKITSAFGDALSYLRLFALGLASASLAVAFNDLADQVRAASGPSFGLLLGMIVFFIGHSLNFVLGIVSGFIHGLRLNFIEFFNWSIPEEGRPFKAFSRKEATSCTR